MLRRKTQQTSKESRISIIVLQLKNRKFLIIKYRLPVHKEHTHTQVYRQTHRLIADRLLQPSAYILKQYKTCVPRFSDNIQHVQSCTLQQRRPNTPLHFKNDIPCQSSCGPFLLLPLGKTSILSTATNKHKLFKHLNTNTIWLYMYLWVLLVQCLEMIFHRSSEEILHQPYPPSKCQNSNNQNQLDRYSAHVYSYNTGQRCNKLYASYRATIYLSYGRCLDLSCMTYMRSST